MMRAGLRAAGVAARRMGWRGALPLAAALGASGCERVVGLEIPEGPRRLVVEGRLERVIGNVSGGQVILLSTTAPYFSATLPPAATGAVVTVSDSRGRVVPFLESAPGRYTTQALEVVVGEAYTLSIRWNGDEYRASEVARPTVPIDSLYFAPPQPGRFSGTGGVRATIDLRDTRGVRNWYLWDQFVDGVRQLGPDSTFKYRIVAPDDAFDGLDIAGFQPYEGVQIPVGAEVLMRQVGLSEAMYRYYLALSDQVSADGSPFAVPPASVRGNVANVTDPSRFALGYFHAAEVSERRATRTQE